MITREISRELLDVAGEYPVVTIVGPRQSGKTTLVQMTFPDKPYRSLEDPDVRVLAQTDPRGFLGDLPEGAILDEIQRAPDLLSFIQGVVDEKKKPGLFILTGSHQPELRYSITQTLAGRTALLTLLPFSFDEVRQFTPELRPFDIIVRGNFPGIYDRSLKPIRFFKNYYQTYVERDVRMLVNLKDATAFQIFVRLLAGRVGQIVNYSNLSNDVGVSATTVKQWISVMESSHLVFILPPYFQNIRKRVVKSPKIYFTDTGLVSYLLGIETEKQAERDPLRGSLYENLIILEVMKWFLNQGRDPGFFYYRDTHGNEVDLVCQAGRHLVPIEIKSAATFTPDFTENIKKFKRIVDDKVSGNGFVLYGGDASSIFKGTQILNLFHTEHPLGLLKKSLNM